MAIIQSGAGSTLWTIDATSNAGRVTVYNQNGVPMGDVSSLSNILNAFNSSVTIVLGGQSTLGISVAGTVGTLTLSFEATMDNVAWFLIPSNAINGSDLTSATSADGYWIASTGGFYAIRTRVSSYTSGSMNVSVNLTPGPSQNIAQSVTGTLTTNIGTTGGLALDSTLTGGAQSTRVTDGTNTATVKAASTAAGAADKALVVAISPNNSVAVTGTFFQGTQPVSGTVTANAGTGNFTVTQSSASNLNANVSGTVTSNIGITNGLALDTTLTGGTSRTKITDGTNNATVKAASTAPVAADTALVVAISPNSSVVTNADGYATTAAPTYTNNTFQPLSITTSGSLRTDSSATVQPVSGTVSANQSGTWIIQPGNTANTTPWLTTINQGGNSATVTASNALKIDGSAVIQPISGTVTANAGSGSFTIAQSTAANLNATVIGTVTANIGTSGLLALDTSITGLQVSQGSTTSGQKGNLIQGAVSTTSPTYTTTQTSPLSLTTSGLLRVDGSGVTQPVSGTVTANAGTGNFTVTQSTAANLNATVIGTVTSNIGTTNGLALDATLTGGNQTTRITDGTNTATVKAASTAAVVADKALVVAISPNNSVAVTGTFFQGTQPVSGTITANAGTGSFTVVQSTAGSLNATVVGSGNFTVTQATASNLNANVSGTVTSNIGTTNGLALDATLAKLTIAQSTALGSNTQAMVAGSVTTGSPTYVTGNINPLSLTTAGALRVDASSTTQPISGTVTANAGTGTFTVGGTVTANIGTTNGIALDATVSGLQVSQGSTTSGQKGGLILGAVTTAAPTYTTAQSSPISITTSGAIRIDGSGSTQPISGTVAATQSGTWTVQPGNTANTTPWLSTISQGGNSATVSAGGALKIDGSASTQPVSGTVTANAGTGNFTVVQASAANLNATVSGTVTSNIGTTNGLALDATLTGGTQRSKITDGTNNAAVKAASTAAAGTDTALVVAISPNNSVAVTGTFFQATQPVSGTITANAGTGNFTVAQATASNLNATIIGTATDNTTNSTTKLPVMSALSNTAAPTWTNGNMVPLSVDTSGALRITGSISASNPSVSTTATAPPGSATYMGGSVTTAAPTYTTGQMNALSLTTTGALRTDASGTTQPISGTITANAGSGTFTVSGTVAATQSGTWTVQPGNTANTTPWLSTISQGGNSATVSGAGALKVDASATTQPVSGTITANIGTTNGLALDTTISGLQVSQGSTTSGQKGNLILGAVSTAAPTYTTAQSSPISLTTAGSVRVDGSGVTQPVSGTVTANAGSGTFAVSGTVTSNQGTATTAANGWFARLTDGTNNVAVKAASTQAASTDPGLVVSLNPLSAQTKASSATVTQVASSATSVTLLAANANRLGAMIVNDSTQILFVKFGTSSSSTSYTTVVPISRGMFEIPFGYTGIISGNWNSAQGFCYVTEILP